MTNIIDNVVETKILEGLAPVVTAISAMEAKIDKGGKAPEIDTAAVKKLVAEAVAKAVPKTQVVHYIPPEGGKGKEVKGAHPKLADCLKWCDWLKPTKRNIALIGPAGSGKSTLARHICEARDLKLHASGAVSSEYKLTGFTDANGRVVDTEFRRWWLEGGAFLWDDADRSNPDAVSVMNDALASGLCAFPDGLFPQHETCILIVTANGNLRGATDVHRTMKGWDSASIDRFKFVPVNYCKKFEEATFNVCPEWTERVQKLREVVEANKLQNIFTVTPRAMVDGQDVLANKVFTQHEVEESLIVRGAPVDAVTRLYKLAGKPSRTLGVIT